MNEFFEDEIIMEIEVGLGFCGEFWYFLYLEIQGWVFFGIGEFQVGIVDYYLFFFSVCFGFLILCSMILNCVYFCYDMF